MIKIENLNRSIGKDIYFLLFIKFETALVEKLWYTDHQNVMQLTTVNCAGNAP